VLYGGACRICRRLAYTVERESLPWRLLRRRNRLLAKLTGGKAPEPGEDPFALVRPRGMRRQRFLRLLTEAREADRAALIAAACRFSGR